MIVSFDIDGVIIPYPKYFLEFVHKIYGINFTTLDECKKYYSFNEYSKIKDIYRHSNEKYMSPIQSEILSLNNVLCELDFKIVVNSSRPFDKYPTMLERTSEWLTKNNFSFESLGSKSAQNLYLQNVNIHIDDEQIEIDRLREEGALNVQFILFKGSTPSAIKDILDRIMEIRSA
jgi:hypothetical protein